MIIRLFYTSKHGCHNIQEITKAVMAVYQLQEEFYPYLTVNFLPNKNNQKGGVVLQTPEKIIKRYYHFDNKYDIINLRKIIWDLINNKKNIKDITKNKYTNETMKFNIIQGWQNKKKKLTDNLCCKVIKQDTNNELNNKIKHEIYKLADNEFTKKSCKEVRYKECADNYPINSQLYKLCKSEVNWLCNNGYPINKVKEFNNKIINDSRNELVKKIQNNKYIDKKIYDDLIFAGFEHFSPQNDNHQFIIVLCIVIIIFIIYNV